MVVASPAWAAGAKDVVGPGAKAVVQGEKPAEKQAEKPAGTAFTAVVVNGQEVFRLADTKGITAAQRADKVRERLRSVLEPDPGEKWKSVQASDITVESVDQQPVIRLRNQNVLSPTAQDAQLNGRKLQDLAQRWSEDLRSALAAIKVDKGNKLPKDFVTTVAGRVDVPAKGGGAGGAPVEKR